MDTLSLIIVTPHRQVLETTAQWIDLPAASGDMRVLPGHAPTLGALGAGIVRYQDAAGSEQRLVVSGGFLEVLAGKVTLLADTAEFPKEIDWVQAQDAWDHLQRAAPGSQVGEIEAEEERRQRMLAQARLEIASK